MNHWHDLKTDPPELRKPVMVTDGVSVYFGQLTRYADNHDTLCFEGVDVGDSKGVCFGAVYSCLDSELIGWMPSADYRPEETYRQKTERIISELRGMMGQKMYYGEMVGAEAPYCHCGPLVYEEPEDYNLEKAVEILERMLAGDFEVEAPEQSADQMLLGMGWRRNLSTCYGYDKGKIIYERCAAEGTDIFTMTFFKSNKWKVYVENTARLPVMLDKFEIDAVLMKMEELYGHRDFVYTHLMKEMEESK